jgi:hypothetical protein
MSVTDQDDMQDRRRTYIDPHNGELLFMEWDTHHDGWVPSTETMHAWQEGRSRIYNPTDNPNIFITMPGHIQWPRLHPTEEDDIRVLMERPWIPDGQAMEGLYEDEIEELDALQRLMTETVLYTPPRINRLESILRPTLVMEMPMTLLVQPPRQTDSILAATLLASLVAPPQPPQQPAPRPPPFPKHLADQVLAAAEAAGQVCPITMEPIQKSTAAVTSCGHVFQKEAITHWMQDHDTCPECRQPCVI